MSRRRGALQPRRRVLAVRRRGRVGDTRTGRARRVDGHVPWHGQDRRRGVRVRVGDDVGTRGDGLVAGEVLAGDVDRLVARARGVAPARRGSSGRAPDRSSLWKASRRTRQCPCGARRSGPARHVTTGRDLVEREREGAGRAVARRVTARARSCTRRPGRPGRRPCREGRSPGRTRRWPASRSSPASGTNPGRSGWRSGAPNHGRCAHVDDHVGARGDGLLPAKSSPSDVDRLMARRSRCPPARRGSSGPPRTGRRSRRRRGTRRCGADLEGRGLATRHHRRDLVERAAVKVPCRAVARRVTARLAGDHDVLAVLVGDRVGRVAAPGRSRRWPASRSSPASGTNPGRSAGGRATPTAVGGVVSIGPVPNGSVQWLSTTLGPETV